MHHRGVLPLIAGLLMTSAILVGILAIRVGPNATLDTAGVLGRRLADLALSHTVQSLGTTSAAAAANPTYVTIGTTDSQTDDNQRITAQVPSAWNQVEASDWTYQGRRVGSYIAASANLSRFFATGSEPGVFIGASQALAQQSNPDAILNVEKGNFGKKCKYVGRSDYRDNFYVGRVDEYSACTTGSPNVHVIATTTPDHSTFVLIRITAHGSADREAMTRILATYQILPPTD